MAKEKVLVAKEKVTFSMGKVTLSSVPMLFSLITRVGGSVESGVGSGDWSCRGGNVFFLRKHI